MKIDDHEVPDILIAILFVLFFPLSVFVWVIYTIIKDNQ